MLKRLIERRESLANRFNNLKVGIDTFVADANETIEKTDATIADLVAKRNDTTYLRNIAQTWK